ncbi:MAG: SpoIID/LytB domain-containing protein [Acidimicrobiales bacterium]
MRLRPLLPRRLSLAVAVAMAVALAAGAVVAIGPARPAGAYPFATVDVSGHGFGHGRGLGQYGSLGYALAGWSHTRILDHYYGGTRMGSVPNAPMTVRILRLDGQETIAVQERGAATTSAGPGQQFKALRVRLIGLNTFEVTSGPGCNGPWSPVAPATVGPVTLASALPQGDDRSAMLQLCEGAGTRWYRGDFTVVDNAGSHTVNRLDMESYLRGVVPRESPSGWGGLGGGQGINALRAQAVAARSYAQVLNNYPYAKTCDTTACQVYGGFASQDAGGFRDLEAATTNAAIADTAGQVRVFTATGAVALTEFSSSTGGYSAGGVFPAVVDDGDAVDANPNHDWKAQVPVADIEAAYPAIGALQSVDVTRRNGLGDLGGRVVELTLRGNRGSQVLTGADFRRFVGVRSDWFSVTNNAGGGIAGYWVLARDGGVFSFGAARFFGSTGAIRLNKPIVGMAATPSGRGYWLVASDGGIFAFGDAVFRGSTGAIRLNQPIVGMASTPSGGGYWLVASDGGIFSFGDAVFRGSTGAITLNQPVVAMASTPTAGGYWLVAADGGIFAFGDAVFRGSLPAIAAPGPARSIQATASSGGYLIATDAGRVYAFGDAPFLGDIATAVPGYPGGVRGLATLRTS